VTDKENWKTLYFFFSTNRGISARLHFIDLVWGQGMDEDKLPVYPFQRSF